MDGLRDNYEERPNLEAQRPRVPIGGRQSWQSASVNDSDTNGLRGSVANPDDPHALTRSMDAGAERRRRHSQKKKQQLLRISSSSFVPLPLDDNDFTTTRRSLQRQQSQQRASLRAQRSLESQVSLPEVLSEEGEEEEEVEITDPNIDGGWAWVVMCASFVLIFIVDGISFSFGVFLDVLIKEFGRDNSTTSLVVSVLNGLYLGAGPIASALAEKFGYRVIGVSGAILTAAAFLASSWSPNIETMIVLYGFLGGLGFCFMYLTAMVTTSLYFEKKRPLAVGVASCGSGIGIFVFPIVMEKLFSVLSWNNCIRIQAGCVLLCSVCALAFRPLQKQQEQQQDRKTFKEDIKRLIDLTLFKRPIFLIITVMGILATIGISTPFIFIKPMAEDKGIQEGQATWLISMMGITNTVGRLLVGALVYFFCANPLLMLAASCIIGGILTTCTVFFNTFVLLSVYACLFGTVYALDAALSTEILARTLGRDSVAGAFGLVCLARGVAFAAGGPIAGALFDHTGNYNATFYFAGSLVIVTGLLSVVAFVVNRRASAVANVRGPLTQQTSLLEDNNAATYGIANGGMNDRDNASVQNYA